jgi:hypothetical protein
VSSKQAKMLLALLERHKNSWIDSRLIMDELGHDERFGAFIAELRNAGHVIDHRQNSDPKRKSWQYKLVVVDKSTIKGGWICCRCGRIEAKDSVKSNTLSERHATSYCLSCKKKQVFEFRS